MRTLEEVRANLRDHVADCRAGAGERVEWYGDIDALGCDSCRARIGKVFTLDEIDVLLTTEFCTAHRDDPDGGCRCTLLPVAE